MSLEALSVSVALPPAVLPMALATVMSPAWLLVPALVVVTVTLVPAFSAVTMLPVVTIALSFVVVKFGLAVMFVSTPAV
jgi:hypothetical protein